jgi:hypothetical protein
MPSEMEQAREEIAATRERLSQTTAELKATVSDQVGRATHAVNPLHYAREFPWAALGLAVGAGLAFALTGADEKAARAAADGAKAAGSALADGAVAAKDAVVDKLSGDDAPAPDRTATPEQESSGLRAQATRAVHDLLDQGLDEILSALGVDRKEIQRTL